MRKEQHGPVRRVVLAAVAFEEPSAESGLRGSQQFDNSAHSHPVGVGDGFRGQIPSGMGQPR